MGSMELMVPPQRGTLSEVSHSPSRCLLCFYRGGVLSEKLSNQIFTILVQVALPLDLMRD